MFLFEFFIGRGADSGSILTLDTAIDESRKETAKGGARFPHRLSTRDSGDPCYYHRLEYDLIIFSLFSLPSFLLLALFLSLFLSPHRRPYAGNFSSPSCCFGRAAAICPPSVCFSSISKQPFLSPCDICIRFQFIIFVVSVFLFSFLGLACVVFSYPIRWHFTCFILEFAFFY